jgi:hypothetical protein
VTTIHVGIAKLDFIFRIIYVNPNVILGDIMIIMDIVKTILLLNISIGKQTRLKVNFKKSMKIINFK